MRTSNASALTRRTFLRGTGIALALPWLETFATDDLKANGTPKRFVSIYHPDGVGVPIRKDPAWKDWSWFPHGGEKDFQLTKVLDVLEPLRRDITIYSGNCFNRHTGCNFFCDRRWFIVVPNEAE